MLYLMQHGAALSKEEDPERPLSEGGIADVQNLARLLRAAGIEFDDVFHSGKLRARQTAEILADTIPPERGPEELRGLGATDPAAPMAEEIAGWTRRVALVSHMPLVARLTGALVADDEEQAPAAFTAGTMVALGAGDRGWQIQWLLRPELLASRND